MPEYLQRTLGREATHLPDMSSKSKYSSLAPSSSAKVSVSFTRTAQAKRQPTALHGHSQKVHPNIGKDKVNGGRGSTKVHNGWRHHIIQSMKVHSFQMQAQHICSQVTQVHISAELEHLRQSRVLTVLGELAICLKAACLISHVPALQKAVSAQAVPGMPGHGRKTISSKLT